MAPSLPPQGTRIQVLCRYSRRLISLLFKWTLGHPAISRTGITENSSIRSFKRRSVRGRVNPPPPPNWAYWRGSQGRELGFLGVNGKLVSGVADSGPKTGSADYASHLGEMQNDPLELPLEGLKTASCWRGDAPAGSGGALESSGLWSPAGSGGALEGLCGVVLSASGGSGVPLGVPLPAMVTGAMDVDETEGVTELPGSEGGSVLDGILLAGEDFGEVGGVFRWGQGGRG